MRLVRPGRHQPHHRLRDARGERARRDVAGVADADHRGAGAAHVGAHEQLAGAQRAGVLADQAVPLQRPLETVVERLLRATDGGAVLRADDEPLARGGEVAVDDGDRELVLIRRRAGCAHAAPDQVGGVGEERGVLRRGVREIGADDRALGAAGAGVALLGQQRPAPAPAAPSR